MTGFHHTKHVIPDLPMSSEQQEAWENDGTTNFLKYYGVAPKGVGTSDNAWQLFKYEWSAGQCISTKTARGTWDNRASYIFT